MKRDRFKKVTQPSCPTCPTGPTGPTRPCGVTFLKHSRLKPPPLEPRELGLIAAVLRRHPEIKSAKLYGSRAKGTHTPRSDVDLALDGDVDPLGTEAIRAELDELPLPYHFDVVSLEEIKNAALREHIRRDGIKVFPEAAP